MTATAGTNFVFKLYNKFYTKPTIRKLNHSHKINF